MAKEVVFEIAWLRPLKLIGLANLFCGLIAFILSLALKSWVVTDEEKEKDPQFYMSLWEKCTKLPKHRTRQDVTPDGPDGDTENDWTCEPATNLGGFVSVAQALIVLAFIIALVCFVLGIVAYCKRDWRILYKISGIVLIVAAVLVLIAVIVFPSKFVDNIPFHVFFWFWWAYGFAWAAFFFMLTAAVLFLISHDRKEIYRTEKRIVV